MKIKTWCWKTAIDRGRRTREEKFGPLVYSKSPKGGKEKEREGERLDEIALNDLRFSLVSPSCSWKRRTSRCCSCRICPSSLPVSILGKSRLKNLKFPAKSSSSFLLLSLPPSSISLVPDVSVAGHATRFASAVRLAVASALLVALLV